ncbi:MAG: hypothetical protein ACRDKV_09420 [Solirubrobacterales bacterium]
MAALALLALASALYAPRAGAVPFGHNLNRPADSPYSCTGWFFPFHTPTTCSAESTHLGTGESGFPPVGVGVVTQVRVRVGPTTGPMQIVVEQALRKDNPSDPGHPTYACCKAISASQVFVPAPNAITTIPTNLVVRQDIAPDPNTGFYTDDHLALSVLDPNVPVPANLDNNPNNVLGFWFPAWQVGQERADAYGAGPYAVVLFDAEWAPAPGADRSPLEFLRRTLPVRAGNVLAPLQCVAGSPCIGPFLLQNLNARLLRLSAARETGSLSKKKRRITYAKKRIKIKAGKKKRVKIPLNRRGKRLLRGRKKVKVWANVNLKGVAKAADPSARVKLKVKKR